MPIRLAIAPPQVARSARWTIALAYLIVFVALDWISYIRPYQGLNITPWNPQPALAIALLLWRPTSLPLVWIGLLLAEVVVRGWPADAAVMALATAAMALVFTVVARLLKARIAPPPVLATRRELAWFTAAAIGGSLGVGITYLGVLAVGGGGPQGSLATAVLRFWVGDAVGMVVTLPVLLVVLDPVRRAEARAVLSQELTLLIATCVLLLLAYVFSRTGPEQFKYFYLLFLPVAWAAVRLGLAGAVLTSVLTQAGLIVAVQSGVTPDLTVFELQALMTALAMTGLLLGVTVDERRRAEEELKGSLRLAAAGQMAAALAHELSQPLTALNSYAEAARLLVADRTLPAEERLERLTGVARLMADDAMRASDVVKRLRDFFRTGHTQLRPVALDPLLREAIDAMHRRAQAQQIALDASIGVMPDVLIDPVQIAVVFRNLLANALDASAAGTGERRVRLVAWLRDDEIRIDVRDSGAGVDPARLHRLFEPAESEKPSGMGIGLSICRAIVEAHGGRLWAEAGPSGIFCMSLPLERGAPG